MGPIEFKLLAEKHLGRQAHPLARCQTGRNRYRQDKKILKTLHQLTIRLAWRWGTAIPQVPKAQADINDTFCHGFMDENKDIIQVGVQGGVVFRIFETVQGDIDLTQGRAGKQGVARLAQQGGVGGQVDLFAMGITICQQQRKVGMQQRLAKQVQGQVVGKITDLSQGVVKLLQSDKGFWPFALVAEAAREVAAIGNLDKDAFEFFQTDMFSKGGHRQGADATLI